MSPTSRIGMAFLVVSLLTIIPYTVFRHNGRGDFHRLEVEVEMMKSGNEKIFQANQKMRRKIASYKTHPQLIERVAREKLQLARKNELVLIFDDSVSVRTTKVSVPELAPPASEE